MGCSRSCLLGLEAVPVESKPRASHHLTTFLFLQKRYTVSQGAMCLKPMSRILNLPGTLFGVALKTALAICSSRPL
jgi:hypothetical protein